MKEPSSKSKANDSHDWPYSFAYVLPKLALFIMLTGPLTIMPGVAVKYFGLSLGAIALAKLLARLFDGITDPLIGYFSDRYQQRFGTRKPLIAVGGVMVMATGVMFFIPYGWDALDPAPVSFVYFMFFYLALTFSWTLMDIPHMAWGVEMSSDAKRRSQRLSFRSMAMFVAPLAFYSIPLLPFFETTEITPETLKFNVYVCLVIMPLCLWVCLRWAPNSLEGDKAQLTTTAVETSIHFSKKQRFQQVVRLIIGNRPLLIFYGAYAFIGLSLSISSGLMFFFVDNYLGAAEKLTYAYIAKYSMGIPAAWFWGIVVQKIGAQQTWIIGMSICVLGLMGIGFLSPGEASFLPYLVCVALLGVGYASCFVAGYMVLAHIADYGKWKFGEDCVGLYFAVRSSIFKFNASMGVAVGLVLVQWLGFDPLMKEMSETAAVALRLSYIAVPLALTVLTIILIILIPLNRNQQSVIRKRLAVRVGR